MIKDNIWVTPIIFVRRYPTFYIRRHYYTIPFERKTNYSTENYYLYSEDLIVVDFNVISTIIDVDAHHRVHPDFVAEIEMHDEVEAQALIAIEIAETHRRQEIVR